MPPSQLYKQYSPDLQGILDGRVRDISLIAERTDIPTLCDISSAYRNQGVAVDWLKTQLEVVNDFANVQQRLTTEQLMAIGEQIFSLYPDISLLEFILFCGRLRRGRYEKWYGAVDGQKILISLDAFMEDRRTDLVRRQEEEHRRLMTRDAATKGIDPTRLVGENPGEFPTLERLLKSGSGIYGSIVKKVTLKDKKK